MGGEDLSNDWFKRKYDLAEGEKANLVYADDFDQTEVELLELSDEMLAMMEAGEELCFKGGPDDEVEPTVPRASRPSPWFRECIACRPVTDVAMASTLSYQVFEWWVECFRMNDWCWYRVTE